MREVSIANLKARTSQILRELGEERVPYLVTRHGKPVAKIVPPDFDVKSAPQLEGMLLPYLLHLSEEEIGPAIDRAMREGRDETIAAMERRTTGAGPVDADLGTDPA